MRRKKIILTVLFLSFLWFLNYTSLLISAGKFDFNDGTTQGWTLDQMYVTSDQTKFTPVIGYTLMNSSNELSAYTGSLLIGRSEQNDIYLESPDLSSNSNWQGISGISVDVKRLLYSPGWGDFPNIFFVQLQLKVIDTADNNKEKLFAEWDGSNFVFHDILTFDKLYQFTWQPSWLTDPRYKVKKIRIRITGPGDVAQELWYRGSWNIDNVSAIGGSPTNNTNPGTNVQINLGNGVNVTFDQVTGAGNTSLTTSSSGTPPPGGFTILPIGSPTYYSITTTATFTGNIKICIQYNDAGLTSQQEAALKLQVYEQPPGQWKNITTSLDMNGNIICGLVTHLSEFAVMFSSGGTTNQWVLTNQPTNGTITCFTVTGEKLFAGTEYGGVFLSPDNGINWNQVNTGLTNLTVRSLCANNAYIFAGTWGGGVFRTNNDGISWTPVNTGLSNLGVATLYISGTNLIAGTWGGGVFLSTNNGSSWTPINAGLTETHIRALLIKLGNFFAGTINGVFYSLNNGARWDARNVGLTNTTAISLTSPADNAAEELFTGTDGGGVFIRTPNTNWTAINNGLSNLHIPYLCFASSNLFAATWGGGVFYTNNMGAAWNAINEGLTDLYIRSLVISGTDIFAGTNNGGIWRRSLSDLISEVPDIASNPPSWNYGSVAVGNNLDKTFVIKNEGTANLNVTGTTLTGANALEFSIQTSGGSFTLAPSATRDIMIKFAPTGAGSKSAALSISSNDPDENPFIVNLTGTGTVNVPDISSNPVSWNYGAINVGANSDKTFVIKNDGNANLDVTVTSLTGANASEFSIQSGGGAFTLAPAGTRDIIVRFSPTSAGGKSASLSISSNDPDENPFAVALSGSGVAVAGIPINPVTTSPQMAGVEFWVSIDVGTNANPVTDLFGISFNLNYTNTTFINYVAAEAGSFIGSGVLFYPTPDDANGKISIGISRMAPQAGVNGFGTVARVKLIAEPATPNNTSIQLSISNVSANNSIGAAITLAPGSLNITIQSGLIVWPGDTNNNGNVDQSDILPLGLYWGKTGPARQNASMTWSGQLAMFWSPQAATYADANGDGTVNQADVLPIGLNWYKTHTQALMAEESSPVQLSKGLITARLMIADSGSTAPDQNFYIDIRANEVSNLFGLSFEMIYTPASIIDPLTVETGPANLLGSDVIFFSIIDKTAGVDSGKVSVGISRKSGQGGVSGSGLVTRIKAHMSANAVNHFSTTLLTLTHIQANDPSGNPIQIDTTSYNLITDIQNDSKIEPAGFALYDNYPNPFNLSTTIAFQLLQPSKISLSIFDLQGHTVRTLVHGDVSAGYHLIQWDGCDDRGNVMASGVYIMRIEARANASNKSFMDSKKMILMK